MRIFTYLILLLLVLLGLTFAFLNAELTTVNYYLGTTRQPLSLLLAVSFGAGALLGLLVGILLYIRIKKDNFRLLSRLKNAEKEVANLRVISLKENTPS